jgi:hypothetical protein
MYYFYDVTEYEFENILHSDLFSNKVDFRFFYEDAIPIIHFSDVRAKQKYRFLKVILELFSTFWRILYACRSVLRTSVHSIYQKNIIFFLINKPTCRDSLK